MGSWSDWRSRSERSGGLRQRDVTLAALLLDLGWAIGVGVASVGGYALLLASAREGRVHMGIESALVALVITLGINATLVVRIAAAFRQRHAALADAEREAAQAEKLASLAGTARGRRARPAPAHLQRKTAPFPRAAPARPRAAAPAGLQRR